MIACIEDPVVIDTVITHLNEKAASAATGLLTQVLSPLQSVKFKPVRITLCVDKAVYLPGNYLLFARVLCQKTAFYITTGRNTR